MKKSLILFFTTLITTTFYHGALAETFNAMALSSDQQISYQKLKSQTSNLSISWSETNKTPRFISIDTPTTAADSSFEDKTIDFINSYKPLFKFTDSDSNNEFIAKTIKTDRYGMNHVVVQQRFKSIPVYGASLTAHYSKDGDLSSINANLLPNIPDVSVDSSITFSQAFEVAEQYLQEHQIPIDGDRDFGSLKKQLYIYNRGLFSHQPEPTHLVWSFTLSDKIFFIDAHDASVVHVLENLLTAKARETYVMADCTDTTGTLTYNEAGLVDGASEDAQAALAHEYAGFVYDYYAQEVFGRDSYDGRSSILKSHVHYIPDDACGADWGNAKWEDEDNSMYYGENFLSLDIAGHEMTHGIVQYSVGESDDDTLTYEDESGALNESYADIFGEFIELENGGEGEWLIGEDLPGDPLRSMSTPSDYDQPDNIANKCTTTNDYCDYAGDSGGVHTNSGIPNNALYLLVNGGANPSSGLTVDNPIGRAASEAIYYQVLTGGYLNTNATFEEAYLATFKVCQELNQADPTTYPFSYCESVYDAFQAVGITSTTTFLHVDIQATPTDGYAPLTVDFDGSDSQSFGGTITDYEWDLDSSVDSDGSGSVVDDVDNTGPVASSAYDDPKTLNARLTITDNTGNSSYDSTAITVNDPLELTFSMSGDGVTAPATVTFDASGTVIYSGAITDYTWNFGDGTTESSGTSATTSHDYTSDGYYTVTLTITTDTGYSETYSHMVWVGAGDPEISGTLSNDTWSATGGTYIIDGLITIADGATLTINPGTVVKFQSSTYIRVDGSLVLAGTAADPIILTSYYDDTYGGDTNGDGGATTPAAEDWRYIRFNPDSYGTISHALIQYGGDEGGGTDYNMLDIQSSNVTIADSTLRYNGLYTISITEASPTITNSVIEYAESGYGGIYVDNGSPMLSGNTLRYNTTGIYATNNSAPTIEGNLFVSDSQYGIYLVSSAMSSVVTNNTFTDITRAIYLDDPASSLTLSGNQSSSSDWGGIVLTGQTDGDFTLAANDLVYIINNLDVSLEDTLSIDPGTIIKFYSTSSDLAISGTLQAVGTTAAPIVFTSLDDDDYGGDTNTDGVSSPSTGNWRQVLFESGSTAQLSYTVIQYGGRTAYPMLEIASDDIIIDQATISNSQTTTIEINNSSPTISGGTITGSIQLYESSATLSGNTLSYPENTALGVSNGAPTISDNFFVDSDIGLSIVGTYTTPTVTNNTFTDNDTYPLVVSGLNGDMVFSGNTGSGNTYNGIQLTGSTTGDATLGQDNDLPYMLNSLTVSTGNTLTIEPGMVLKFPFTFSKLAVNGTLLADATDEEPIVFTSYKDDSYGGDTNGDGTATTAAAGDWRQMSFGSGSQATLDHVIIQYGGDYSSYPMVDINSNKVTIDNSVLTISDYQAVRMTNASPTITATEISGSRYGIYATGSNPVLTNNSITDNSSYGLYNASSTVTINAENSWWGTSAGPYHATTNPTGTGNTVSSYVDFTPWSTIDILTIDTTPPSDATLGAVSKDARTPSLTVNWTNPADSDFDHIQIDRTNVTAGTTTTLSSTETGTSYIDTTPSFNVMYSYTLYACDTSSNCSSGVTTSSNRLRNPAPTGLTLTAGDKSITVKASSSAATLGGYIIYYGTSRAALTNTLDVGNVTTNTITGLTNGTRYYVTVTAYNTSGVESASSAIKNTVPHH